jgi:hypothetical protein
MIRLYHFPGNNDAVLPGALFRVPGIRHVPNRRILCAGFFKRSFLSIMQRLMATIKKPEHSVRLGGSTQYVRGASFDNGQAPV